MKNMMDPFSKWVQNTPKQAPLNFMLGDLESEAKTITFGLLSTILQFFIFPGISKNCGNSSNPENPKVRKLPPIIYNLFGRLLLV
jgi:hypothetical protein